MSPGGGEDEFAIVNVQLMEGGPEITFTQHYLDTMPARECATVRGRPPRPNQAPLSKLADAALALRETKRRCVCPFLLDSLGLSKSIRQEKRSRTTTDFSHYTDSLSPGVSSVLWPT